jgi:hypothetical protein
VGQGSGVRSTIAKRASAIVAGVSALLALLLPWPHPFRASSCDGAVWEMPHDIVAYLYALHLEEAWSAARPRDRQELERHLHFYSTQVIAPADSCWGNRYSLSSGQVMVRYLIAWHAPLDVVYDSAGRVDAIFTSYE